MSTHPDVVIVGAGPSGLVLAIVLARHGVRFRIIDRKEGPVAQSRAALVHVRTLELLDGLGLAARAVQRGAPIDQVEILQHGRPAARFPLAGPDAATPFPYALALPQDRLEELLVEELAAQGHGVEWGSALDGLAVDGEPRVRVRAADGAVETITPRWVVGADGAGSSVRQALGVGFAGLTYDQTGLLADVELDADPTQLPGPGAIRLNLTRGGFVGLLALPDGRHRIFGALPAHLAVRPASVEVSHEPYAAVAVGELQRWFDDYFGMEATLARTSWTSLFRLHSRIADRFRVGPAFLLGDAAHIHSPAGGQGMNLGIGDAVNLGWKLGLVATGRARAQLLDSYEAERRPVARSVLRFSDRGFTLETTASPIATWLRGHLGVRLIGPASRLPVVRRAVFAMFAQTWIGYRRSPAVSGDSRARVRAGDRLPNPTASELDAVSHTLILIRPSGAHPTQPGTAVDVTRRLRIPVAVRDVPADDRLTPTRHGLVVLVRPDGHIGYLGDPDDKSRLETYLNRLYTSTTPAKP